MIGNCTERARAVAARPLPHGDARQEDGKHRGADAHRQPRVRDRVFLPRAEP